MLLKRQFFLHDKYTLSHINLMEERTHSYSIGRKKGHIHFLHITKEIIDKEIIFARPVCKNKMLNLIVIAFPKIY